MKKVKLTKKNAEKLTNEFESQLRDRLSPFNSYGISKNEINGYTLFNVYSIGVTQFISSTIINIVIELCDESKIKKESMFYGIESCTIAETEIPCITITIDRL